MGQQPRSGSGRGGKGSGRGGSKGKGGGKGKGGKKNEPVPDSASLDAEMDAYFNSKGGEGEEAAKEVPTKEAPTKEASKKSTFTGQPPAAAAATGTGEASTADEPVNE